MLGNSYCARRLGLDCSSESICETRHLLPNHNRVPTTRPATRTRRRPSHGQHLFDGLLNRPTKARIMTTLTRVTRMMPMGGVTELHNDSPYTGNLSLATAEDFGFSPATRPAHPPRTNSPDAGIPGARVGSVPMGVSRTKSPCAGISTGQVAVMPSSRTVSDLWLSRKGLASSIGIVPRVGAPPAGVAESGALTEELTGLGRPRSRAATSGFQHVHDLLGRLNVSLLGDVGASAPLTAPRRGLNRETRRGRRFRVRHIS